jgi:hypothetical protein
MKSFSAKDPRESIIVSMDFTKLLSAGESITSASTTSAAVISSDPNAGDMITGPTTVTGNISSQRIEGGLSGVTYLLSAIAVTDQGNTIVLSGQLLVQNGGVQ